MTTCPAELRIRARGGRSHPTLHSSLASSLAASHHLLPHAAPFILGQRVRGADVDASAEAAAMGPALDFGQLWSFPATPEMMVAAPAMAGEASAARVGNYLPMPQGNLNLLVSFSGGPGAAAAAAAATGLAEEETAH